jgi:hypothetical protein
MSPGLSFFALRTQVSYWAWTTSILLDAFTMHHNIHTFVWIFKNQHYIPLSIYLLNELNKKETMNAKFISQQKKTMIAKSISNHDC